MSTWQVEPLGPWNRPVTRSRASHARFYVRGANPDSRRLPTWAEVRDGLLAEIDQLNPVGTVAIRLDGERTRRDGLPGKGAFPGVAVSFTSREHGVLTYATDNFESWWANLRAIALSLEALRAVDRYGVTRSGEQYAGWRQIEATSVAPFSTADGAVRWLRERLGGDEPDTAAGVRTLVRRAQREMHPDTDADRAQWDLLEQAIDLMRKGGLL